MTTYPVETDRTPREQPALRPSFLVWAITALVAGLVLLSVVMPVVGTLNSALDAAQSTQLGARYGTADQ